MNTQKSFLYAAMLIALSVNTDAMEKNSDAMVAAPAIRNAVGENLHANQIARSAVLARLEASGLADHSRHAAPPSTKLDIWLMALSGAGLIVLQLRRKQKTLPQRPLIFSDNKLHGGRHAQQHSDAVGELVGQS